MAQETIEAFQADLTKLATEANRLQHEIIRIANKTTVYTEFHAQWSEVCGYLCRRDDVNIPAGLPSEAIRLMEDQKAVTAERDALRKMVMEFAGDLTRLNPALFWHGGCSLKAALAFVRSALEAGYVPSALPRAPTTGG